MGWFGRGRDREQPPAATPGPDAPPDEDLADSPAALRSAAVEINRFVNRNAGRLPGEAVVAARRITDTLLEIIATSQVRELDVYAVLTVRGILGDYLPTTLRTYLAVDPALLETPRGSGIAPAQSLRDQLAALQSSASATLLAVRNQDADALVTQGNFLRTKFTGSDLDL